MRRIAVALLAVAALSMPVGAAESPTPAHRQAAEEFLSVMNLEKSMMGGASAMVDVMTQQNATLAPYRDVMLRWAQSILTWENFEPRVVVMYTESFTESELREMTAFYRTPTGEKALTLMPEMMQRGALLGGEVAKEHLPELEKMLKARATELEKPATRK